MFHKREWGVIVCITLLILLLLPTLAACKNQEKTPNETSGNPQESQPDEERKYLDDLGAYDFGGEEFKVLSVTAKVGTYTTFDVEDYSGTLVDQAIYDRNREIEERFNVIFTAEDDGYSKCFTVIQQEALAPTENYDLVMLINRNACTALLSQWILLPSQIPHLDLEKDYYMQDINDMCTLNGVQMFAYSDESIYTLERATCVVYNSQMKEAYGMGDFYQMVDNGEWTVEKMYQLIEQGTTIDTTTNETTQWGLYGHGANMFTSFWFGAGQTMITVNANGSMRFTAGSNQNIISLTDKFLEAVDAGRIGFTMDYSDESAWSQPFIDGKSLFVSTIIGKIYLLKDIEGWDYGVLPYPMLNADQNKYYSRVVDAWLHTVPVNCKNRERVGVILEALAAASAKYVVPAYYDNTLLTRVLREPRSVEMVEMIRQNRILDLADVTWFADARDPIDQQVFVKRTKTFTNLCATSVTSQINFQIAQTNKKLEALAAVIQ